jgi:RNA polymerase sigma-70 factor, ECF subfamily
MFCVHMVYYWRVILSTIGTLICTSGAIVEKNTQAGDGFPLSNKAAAALIRKIQDRDLSALAALYDKSGRLFFGLILNILGDKALAEEVLLDVYTHIWSHAESCTPERAPLEWMLSIARTRAVARLQWSKRNRRGREFSFPDPGSTMTTVPELQQLARSSINALIPAQREILDWIFYSGLSCSEIATQIGKPLGAIRTHACLGMSKLSDRFRPIFDDGKEATGGAH